MVAPLGGQLDLLVQWLEPILDRPGLVREPAFQIVVGEAASDGAIEFEPFDALVGPGADRRGGRRRAGDPASSRSSRSARRSAQTATTHPRVVLARADGTHDYEPIEAVASEAVLIESLMLV